ncbi:hypothetical protein TKK_0017856 [Trichogramma kaykai]
MEVAGSIVQAMVATEAGPDSRPAVKGECMSEFNICPNFLMELKVLALIYRWPSRASHRVRGTPVISEADALRKTRIGCFRSIQRFHFADEVKALRGKRNLSKRSHLSRLCPFYDRDGLLRVCEHFSDNNAREVVSVQRNRQTTEKLQEAIVTDGDGHYALSDKTVLISDSDSNASTIEPPEIQVNSESTSQLHVKSSEENVEESCAHSSVEPSSSLSKQPKVTTAFDKQMMFKSGSKASECDQKLMRMIVDCNLPVHIVDKESLRDFIRSLNAHYAPPGRKKMTELIEKKYAYLSAKLKNTLSALDAVSITTDIWTDTLNTQSYLGLSAHFTEDNEFKTAMIGVHALNNSHTSDNIQVWIEEILNEWNLKNTQIMAVIADGAANIKSALKACFGAPKVLHCFAHILNLVVTGAISSESLITDLLKKVKNVVTFFKHSVNAADALKKETPLKLKQSCETRWNSTYYMIQRYLKVHDYVIKILCNTKSAPPVISADEVDILQEMTSLLEPFEYATKLVSGEKYVTISKVIPLIFEMKTGMDTYEPTTLQCSKLKNELIEQFNTRFKSTEDISIIAQATILDPRFKKVPFSDHDACSRAIQKISDTLYIENLVDRTPFHSEKIDRPTDKSTGGYWTHYKKKAQQTNEQMNPEDVHLNELQHYLMMPTEDFDTCNPLVFWSKYNNSPLGKYAKKLLSVVATSVPCERIFSKAGRILTEDRNRLSPKHFKEFLFSSSIDRDNWDFFKQKWIPNSVCPKCRQTFSQWERTKEVDKLKYSQPTESNQPSNADDCYFCKTDVRRYDSAKKDSIKYPLVSSVRKAVEKGEQEDVDEYMNVLEILSIESEPEDCNIEEKITEDDNEEYDSNDDFSESEEEVEDLSIEFLPGTEKSSIVRKFTQAELNDLIRDLGLAKDGAEYLDSTLKSRNMLEKGTNVSYYRTRNDSFKQFFEEKEFDDEKLEMEYDTEVNDDDHADDQTQEFELEKLQPSHTSCHGRFKESTTVDSTDLKLKKDSHRAHKKLKQVMKENEEVIQNLINCKQELENSRKLNESLAKSLNIKFHLQKDVWDTIMAEAPLGAMTYSKNFPPLKIIKEDPVNNTIKKFLILQLNSYFLSSRDSND